MVVVVQLKDLIGIGIILLVLILYGMAVFIDWYRSRNP